MKLIPKPMKGILDKEIERKMTEEHVSIRQSEQNDKIEMDTVT